MHQMVKDETGNKYGKLTVIEYADKDRLGNALWKVQCECGNELVVRGYSLRNGNTKSCGCSRGEFISAATKNYWDKKGRKPRLPKHDRVGRPSTPAEIKARALQLVEEEGLSYRKAAAQVERETGYTIGYNIIHKWHKGKY